MSRVQNPYGRFTSSFFPQGTLNYLSQLVGHFGEEGKGHSFSRKASRCCSGATPVKWCQTFAAASRHSPVTSGRPPTSTRAGSGTRTTSRTTGIEKPSGPCEFFSNSAFFLLSVGNSILACFIPRHELKSKIF